MLIPIFKLIIIVFNSYNFIAKLANKTSYKTSAIGTTF